MKLFPNVVLCLVLLGGLFQSDSFALNRKLIDVDYFDFEGNRTRSYYEIFNTSLTETVTLRTVYFLGESGIPGGNYAWNGKDGTVINPLGKTWFSAEETEVPFDLAHMMVLTWDGPADAVKVIGVSKEFDSNGNVLASHDIDPF